MKEKEYLTKERHEELVKELEYLKTIKRKELADKLGYARSLGDLSENAEYHEARDEQGMTEDRIQKIEEILKNAVIVSGHHTDAVGIGSVVTVEKQGDKKEKVYTIVGGEESDLLQGKISIHSPFGKAVMGKKKGESFSYSAPSGTVAYKIISIK